MTVAELILHLQLFNQELTVVIETMQEMEDAAIVTLNKPTGACVIRGEFV